MLELVNICKDYYIDKKPFRALNNINLYFPKNEFVSILGPSGCGKTTTLNIIGGLDKYTSGDLVIEGKSTKSFNDSDWDNYRNKRIGFVFQNYNLVPHLNILSNVMLSLTLAGTSKSQRTKRAKEALDMVGLKDLYKKKPNQLSGGQMQRVAIARSLVNNPEIILADEPTGALDSKTSIQIMNILKQISKDRLVIMVTHNEELAKKYSNRIIYFKDGQVVDDTKQGDLKRKAKEEKEYLDQNNIGKLKIVDEKNNKLKLNVLKKNKKEKTHMSFITALGISLQNLKTKKGRTILTSIAASVGIIGVALVLSISNGFTNYINRVETETASQLPISVPSYSVKYDTIDSSQYNQSKTYPDAQEIYPYISLSTKQNMTISYNNFTNKYFTYLDKLRDEDHLLNDYIINYSTNYKYHLMTEFPESIDGSTSAYLGQVSTGQSGSISSLISSYTGLPTSVFHQLYGKEEYILKSYDVIAGRYPTKVNEFVLVCDDTNSINFSTLKYLGFYNSVDTQEQVQDSELATKVKPISYEDIFNKKYKIFLNDQMYNATTYDSSEITGETTSNEEVYYKNKSYQELFNDDESGMTCSIVGILRPSRDSSLSTMTTGLCYLNSLQTYMSEGNNKGELVTNIFDQVRLKEGKTKLTVFNSVINLLSNTDSSDITNILSDFNSIISDNFYLFDLYSEKTTSVSSFFSECKNEGVSLVPSDLKNKDFNSTTLVKYITEAFSATDELDFKKAIIGIAAYINSYSEISSLVIFPKDLTSKKELLAKLDAFNEIEPDSVDHASSAKERVYYTDYVGTITDSLGEMINVISIVLIVFASISLVVSCVMTGIITYNSVLERTKEIGILRAIGARKVDVGRLFEAESCIIGFISGIIGCLVAYLICIPTNLILNALFSEYNIHNLANFSPIHALILIAISIVLTFISGLFPARIAANKDPVVALRSE